MTLTAPPNRTYVIQESSTCSSGPADWMDLATVTNSTGQVEWIDAEACNTATRFYRAVKQ